MKMGDDLRLEDVPDGCGCTEIWEYMSRRRDTQSESNEESEDNLSTAQCNDD
jgi:hypothetical protein